MGRLSIKAFSCIIGVAVYCHLVADVRSDILSLTNNKRTKIVWTRNHDLLGFDTQISQQTTIHHENFQPEKPLLTHDASKIIYGWYDSIDTYIINWDGSGRKKLMDGMCGALWYDQTIGKQYAIVCRGNKVAPIWMVNIDDTSDKQLVWNGDSVNAAWMDISSDGKRIASTWPHPDAGVLDVASGQVIEVSNSGFGCWTGLSPDTLYTFAFFDNEHRRWRIWDWNGTAYTNERAVALDQIPGNHGRTVYFPKWSNHRSFMTVTGAAYGDAGDEPSALYFGKFNVGLTEIIEWVKVSSPTGTTKDMFGHAWVEPEPVGVTLRLRSGQGLRLRQRGSVLKCWNDGMMEFDVSGRCLTKPNIGKSVPVLTIVRFDLLAKHGRVRIARSYGLP